LHSLAPPLLSQSGGALQEPRPVFRAESSVVLIPFHVERDKKFVANLTAGEILLLEDGTPRTFTALEGGQSRTLPLQTAILFASQQTVAPSYSPTTFDVAAIQSFLLDRVPSAQLAVYDYENLLMPLCEPTRDTRVLKKALEQASRLIWESYRVPYAERRSPAPRGSISLDDWVWLPRGMRNGVQEYYPARKPGMRSGADELYPAIEAAARREALRRGEASRALVVFGTGERGRTAVVAAGTVRLGRPTEKGIQPEELLPILRQLGIRLYPVRLDEWLFHDVRARRPGPPERDVRTFLDLGPATGGLSFDPEQITGTVMGEIFGTIAEHMRTEYVLAFQPAPTPVGSAGHRLEVRLRPGVAGTVSGGVREVTY
jgi:hypothetical protein